MTHTEAATMQLSSEAAVGVPLKFVLVRGRRVVEQRRTRLLCPSLEDVKGCVRQWACGVFTLRYVDDEGDLVTVDLDEEWAECVALWREARGADDADVCAQQHALRLVVTIGAQDGSAVCLGQQRHPRHRDAQGDGHRNRHHQHMHGRHGAMPGIRQLLAEWQAHTQGQEQKQAGDVEGEVESESVQEVTPCCRRSVKHAGQHGPRCRVHGKKSGDDDTDKAAQMATAPTSEELEAPCCRRSVKHAGQHGPRCRVHGRKSADATGNSTMPLPTLQGQKFQHRWQSVQEGTPCCRRSVKHAGQHGPRCRVHGKKSGDDDTDKAAQMATAPTPEELEAPCCRRSVKRAGKHGPRCHVYGRKGVHATEAATPAVEPSAPPATEELAVQEVLVQSNEEAVVHENSAGVTALRNMGFDITADVRAVLERHNGDVAAVLEEML